MILLHYYQLARINGVFIQGAYGPNDDGQALSSPRDLFSLPLSSRRGAKDFGLKPRWLDAAVSIFRKHLKPLTSTHRFFSEVCVIANMCNAIQGMLEMTSAKRLSRYFPRSEDTSGDSTTPFTTLTALIPNELDVTVSKRVMSAFIYHFSTTSTAILSVE